MGISSHAHDTWVLPFKSTGTCPWKTKIKSWV